MRELLTHVSKQLQQQQLSVVTAESCTGGWLAKTITDLAGSSAIFDRGFVTYSNASKQDMLGVQATTLDEHGAVSEAVVAEMATGALSRSQADIAVAISGVAGPGGGTEEKPVGLVCFGFKQMDQEVITQTKHFMGDRNAVRQQAVEYSLETIQKLISEK